MCIFAKLSLPFWWLRKTIDSILPQYDFIEIGDVGFVFSVTFKFDNCETEFEIISQYHLISGQQRD